MLRRVRRSTNFSLNLKGPHMKRIDLKSSVRVSASAVLLGRLFAVLTVLLVLNVIPASANKDGCSNATLKGDYGFTVSGFQPNPDGTTSPIACSVCRRYTRAYLRHLFAAGELTAAILATHHNIHFYLDLMRQIREAIGFGNLVKFSSEVRARYAAGPA